MTQDAKCPAPVSSRVLTRQQLLEMGFTDYAIASKCANGEWQRSHQGIYLLPSKNGANESPRQPRLLAIDAALEALGPAATIVLQTAAELWGIYVPHQDDATIHVSVTPWSARAHRGTVQIHQLRFLDGDVVRREDGIQLTNPVRTVADLLRLFDRNKAVAIADSALRQGILKQDDLAELSRRLDRRRGAKKARERLSLVDGRSASPLETRLRLVLVDGGLPPPELQYPILDDFGNIVAVADMAWPQSKLIVEADGHSFHQQPEALLRDRRRQNDIINLDWQLLRFTWADCDRPAYVCSTVRRALDRRSMTSDSPVLSSHRLRDFLDNLS